MAARDPNGKSDPYCIVYLGGTTDFSHRTEKKSATLDPVWDEKFVLHGKVLAPFVSGQGEWDRGREGWWDGRREGEWDGRREGRRRVSGMEGGRKEGG